MTKRARLEQAGNQNRLVNCAYQVWPYSPDTIETIWQEYPDADRTPQLLAQLAKQAESFDQGDTERSQRLLNALIHEVGCADNEAIEKTTRTLLGDPVKTTDASPDLVLSPWASAVVQINSQALIDTLVDETLNDEQAVRLYHRVLENKDYFSADQIRSVVETVLPVQSGRDKTAAAITKSLEDDAIKLFGTEEQKRSLCETVLNIFADVPKQDLKSQLARVCKGLGLKYVIADGGYRQNLSEEDLRIIEQHTGKISS